MDGCKVYMKADVYVKLGRTGQNHLGFKQDEEYSAQLTEDKKGIIVHGEAPDYDYGVGEPVVTFFSIFDPDDERFEKNNRLKAMLGERP